jgi:predicted ABC-type sugar transport system permease subunit
LELLLLLSALLSGLTGVMSGGREADVPQMERSASLQSVEAVVHVAEAVVAQPAAFALVILFALILFLRPLSRWRIKAPLLARYPAPKNERRLE